MYYCKFNLLCVYIYKYITRTVYICIPISKTETFGTHITTIALPGACLAGPEDACQKFREIAEKRFKELAPEPLEDDRGWRLTRSGAPPV